MAQAARLSLRMQKELKLLLSDPPPRASFPSLSAAAAGLSSSSSLTAIDAEIQGPEGTVYSGGVFKIRIQIPDRYPFQPPLVTFTTPIYHPNIDNGGRICLDILNLPPKGAWQPSLNISTVITSIGLLLSEPNPDDGLMCEASREFKYNRQAFDLKARTMTEKYAKASSGTVSCSNQGTKQTGEHGLTDNIEVACIVNTSEPLGMCKKLSLDPSISHCKKVDDRKVNVVSDPVLYTLESKRKSETGDSNPKLKGIDEVHKMGGSYLSKKQKLSLKLPSQPRQSECDNENCPVDQQVPSHSVPTKIQTFNGSNSQRSQVSKCNKQDSDTDPACQGRVSLTYENCKRNAGSKKLSSGHSAMSRNHEKCGNGNLIPVRNHEKCDKPEFANGDVIELHGHEQDNFKRHSQPLSLSEPKSCSRPHQRGCTEKYQTSKDHSDAAQPDSPLTVIVLDSDESDQEEERISCRRSKLSLLSKRPSLGTTKEHKALAGANK